MRILKSLILGLLILMTVACESLQMKSPEIYAANRTAEVFGKAAISDCTAEEISVMRVAARAVGTSSWTSYVKVRITNFHSGPVNIEDESGQVVVGLCSGGSITLFRARNLLTDGANFSYRYTAKGTFPDGSFGIDYSETFTLTKYDISGGRGQQFPNWEIHLRKINR